MTLILRHSDREDQQPLLASLEAGFARQKARREARVPKIRDGEGRFA